MNRQLITIDRLGRMRSLDFKGRGVDLRRFGQVRIERTTEIEWDEGCQAWIVRFLRLGRFSGRILDTGIGWLAGKEALMPLLTTATVAEDTRLLFGDYVHANAAEVVVIQSLRQQRFV